MKINCYEMRGENYRMKKTLFVLKLTIFSLILGLMRLSASTYMQDRKITLDLKGGTLIDVFTQIEAQSEFVFIYKSETTNPNKKIDVKVKGTKVDMILENVLQNSGLKFEINNKQIIITPDRSIPFNKNEKINKENMQPLNKKDLSSTMNDNKGVSLPGVKVIVKETSQRHNYR